MKPRSLVILGSAGSIGRSCLDVIKTHPGAFVVKALATYSNVELLVKQYQTFQPEYVCIVDPAKAKLAAQAFAGEPVRVLVGAEDMMSLASLDGVDLVVNAIVGAAGLRASLETVHAGKTLALANKESLVAGGPLFQPLIASGDATVLPIDSEHSAIWQALACGRKEEIRNLILTASGGPFRDYPKDKFREITVEQALNHPTWQMGAKITIDSATLVNKGLEVIEAVTLFGIPAARIKVMIHPQSIIHSMVEFIDSSIVAQLSRPDMRLPITYALFWPERVDSDFGRLDWSLACSLNLEPPDFEKFPLLRLAYEVAETGGTAPSIYNAANEVAVAAFLNKEICFSDMTEVITRTVRSLEAAAKPGLAEIEAADQQAREFARKSLESVRC